MLRDIVLPHYDKEKPASVRQSWPEIAKRVPGRSGKQCRERWHNHVAPHVDHRPWTEEELTVLKAAYQVHGNRWAVLASLLPGRTCCKVKNMMVMLEERGEVQKVRNEQTKRMAEDEDGDVEPPSTCTKKSKKKSRLDENGACDLDVLGLPGGEMDILLDEIMMGSDMNDGRRAPQRSKKGAVGRRLVNDFTALLASEPPFAVLPERPPECPGATIQIVLNAPPRAVPNPRSVMHYTVPKCTVGSAREEMGDVLRKINKVINKR